MHTLKNSENRSSMSVTVNGKRVRLFFASEPNVEAASYIKKTLIHAYTLKADLALCGGEL